MRDLARRSADPFGVRSIGKPLALVDVDDVLQVDEAGRRMLVEVRDHRAAALHRRIHGRVVRAQSLVEERRQERAVDEMVEDGRVGQVPHEIDLTVEKRLQLLEADDERAVEARVLVQRGRHVHGVGLARRLEQIAETPVQRHADLVRHAEGEDRHLGSLETLRVEQRAGAEQLDDVRARGSEVVRQLAIAAVHLRRRGQQVCSISVPSNACRNSS